MFEKFISKSENFVTIWSLETAPTNEFEIINLSYSTFYDKADSDENGINDANEDEDGDELSNLKEQELGTNPL